WTSAWSSSGWGWANTGQWPVGAYKVVLSVDGREIAAGSFEIFRPTTAPPIIEKPPLPETKPVQPNNVSVDVVRDALAMRGYRDLAIEVNGNNVSIAGQVEKMQDIITVRSVVKAIPGVRGVYTYRLAPKSSRLSETGLIVKRITIALQTA